MQKIITWSGPKSNRFEQLQCTIVAKGINDDERGGKAKVSSISGDASRVGCSYVLMPVFLFISKLLLFWCFLFAKTLKLCVILSVTLICFDIKPNVILLKRR